MSTDYDISQSILEILNVDGYSFTLEEIKEALDVLQEIPKSLIIVNLPTQIFEDSSIQAHFENVFREYDPECRVCYLKSFKRVRVDMKSGEAALMVRLRFHQLPAVAPPSSSSPLTTSNCRSEESAANNGQETNCSSPSTAPSFDDHVINTTTAASCNNIHSQTTQHKTNTSPNFPITNFVRLVQECAANKMPPIKCYFADDVSKSKSSNAVVVGGANNVEQQDDALEQHSEIESNCNGFLQPPKPQKQFLISPPASPPVGWEPSIESEPVLNYELLTALASLAPGETHELHPPTDNHPAIIVTPCHDDDDNDANNDADDVTDDEKTERRRMPTVLATRRRGGAVGCRAKIVQTRCPERR